MLRFAEAVEETHGGRDCPDSVQEYSGSAVGSSKPLFFGIHAGDFCVFVGVTLWHPGRDYDIGWLVIGACSYELILDAGLSVPGMHVVVHATVRHIVQSEGTFSAA